MWASAWAEPWKPSFSEGVEVDSKECSIFLAFPTSSSCLIEMMMREKEEREISVGKKII